MAAVALSQWHSAMTELLVAEGVTFKCMGRTLVDGVDLALRPGDFKIVVGPNGAGKSTLLKLLSGETRPSAGQVRVKGRPLSTWSPAALAHVRAVMPQASEMSFPFTAFEVVRLGVGVLGRGLSQTDRGRIVHEAMERAGVWHLAQQNFQTLSGGEKQRVHFARVIAQLAAGRTIEGDQILLLDEPIASLDPKHQLALLDEVRTMVHNGIAAMAVLHDLQLAAYAGTSFLLLEKGRAVAHGDAEKVLTSMNVSAVFSIALTQTVLPPIPWRRL
jgi:iron complex transport system ATP-binding protein